MTTRSNEAETRLWLIDPVLRSKAVRYLFSTNGRRHAEFDQKLLQGRARTLDLLHARRDNGECLGAV